MVDVRCRPILRYSSKWPLPVCLYRAARLQATLSLNAQAAHITSHSTVGSPGRAMLITIRQWCQLKSITTFIKMFFFSSSSSLKCFQKLFSWCTLLHYQPIKRGETLFWQKKKVSKLRSVDLCPRGLRAKYWFICRAFSAWNHLLMAPSVAGRVTGGGRYDLWGVGKVISTQ